MKNAWTVLCIISVLYPIAARGTTFTFSDDALMSLDYKYESTYTSASILSITNIEGPGVRFNFLYPDPLNSSGKYPSLHWVSCIYGGSGTLTGRDISMFDAFALKFTLLSANGVSSPDAVGPLVIGASINGLDYAYAFRPEIIAINSSYDPTSATSITTTDAKQIKLVGFTCYIPYWWYDSSPSPWDPQGANISLLVEPAPGAVVIPEPTTLLLLGLGAVMLRRQHKTR